MKTYLVGGAVRDSLLNYPFTERDWVVVGGSPQELLEQGYKQVGIDFPVFLHPKTHEEYALARTERKQGSGYKGFICDANSHVTLEQDLVRRDLTINAIAMDCNGILIDPYNGALDLKNKCLRHVSPAFVEDPVRVLRVARFNARYHHLGFYVADETLALMQELAQRGELKHLVPERVWKEWAHSLKEKNPECFLETLHACGALSYILPEINFSPDIINILQQATRRSYDPKIRFAAILAFSERINELCQRLHVPVEYREIANKVSALNEEISQAKTLPAQQIVALLDSADAFRRPKMFEQILTACEAVRDSNKINDQITKKWHNALALCLTINAKSFIQQGIQGAAIKACIRSAREQIIRNEHEKQ